MSADDMHDETKAIHKGEKNVDGGVVTPIDRSTTYAQSGAHLSNPYFYGRLGGPTMSALEEKLAALEDAKFALTFASGMGAVDISARALLNMGDRILAFDDLYGGTKGLFNKIYTKAGITIRYEDATNTQSFLKQVGPQTKMIWLESPTNPMLKICDIEAISEIKAKYPDIIIAVDNTFASPFGQRPLALGADISVHSLTKYIGGHSDVLAGAVMLNREDLYKEIFKTRSLCGNIISPDECALVARGAKTLHLRMEAHQKNAIKMAKFLQAHPQVEWVIYPGLKNHPQHALAARQMKNFGGVCTFKLKGTKQNVDKFLNNLKIIICAVSLGGVESLIEVPSQMTHKNSTTAMKDSIEDNIIRLAVGIENIQDLKKDMETALHLAFS